MDQVKIGKFIQKLRKEQNLTQKELAEKLNVSDKTISKWETGNGMPDLIFLKPLSDIFGITVNELLSGELVDEKEMKKKTEENLMNALKYSHDEIKRNKLNMIIILLGIGLFTFTLLFLIRSLKIWFILISLIIIMVGIYRIKRAHKMITCVFFLVGSFCLLLALDYYNVNRGKEPMLAYSVKEIHNQIMEYKTLFYNVYRCNVGTINEYYEVDFTKDKAICMHPFDPNISDISRILNFQNKYLGNNSNTVSLYYALPLSKYGFTTEIDSVDYGIKIYYNNTEFYIKEDNQDDLFVKRSLLYNAISTFILIDNVKYIEYDFSGSSYSITKSSVIQKYDNYDKIISENKINENNFRQYVSEKVVDNSFVNLMFEQLFVSK